MVNLLVIARIGQYAEQLYPQKREFALEFIKWLSAWKDKVG